MKRHNFQLLNWFLPVMILGILGLSACDPDEESLGPLRMFMPSGVISSTSSVNNVKLAWKTPVNSVESNTTYTVEVATDTLFQNPVMKDGAVFSVQTDSAGVTLTDEQLEVQQLYYARVKANASGDRPESNWLYSSRFRIRGEQILLTPSRQEITDNAIVVRWNPYEGLTRIVATPQGVEGAMPVNIELTEADLTARSKEITGLEPSTSYRIQIFQNNILRGFLTARTISGIAGVTVDLTGNTDPAALMEAIASAPSGSTIILPKGATYNISSTILLDKSITIRSELSTDTRLPILLFTSNFNIAAASSIDSVVFRDVVLRSDNYASRYVFNITNGGTIGKIKLDGTHTEIFRGVVRLQSGGVTLRRYEILNSVVDSISNFGVLTVGGTNNFAENILFRNSTFYKVERVIVSSTAANSIVIENCTFFETPESGRYIADYGANNVSPGGIKVMNSIFGIGKALGADRAGRGIRAGTGTLIESSGSYSTSDRVVGANPIPGVTTYGKTSFELFQDPKNGNFTIIDPAFPGGASAGDPRWWRP